MKGVLYPVLVKIGQIIDFLTKSGIGLTSVFIIPVIIIKLGTIILSNWSSKPAPDSSGRKLYSTLD